MTSHADQGEFGFQIAPMLDVLFVLLLFFMVSAGVQKHEAMLTTQLPGKGAPPGPLVQVNLNIAEDGQVLFNGVATDTPSDDQLPDTMARLKAAIADSPERPVVVRPAATTRHQRVIDVLNMCKAAQIKNVAFGTLTE